MTHSPNHPIRVGNTLCNGVTIHYQDEGAESDPAIILIMGLGAQLTQWPQALVNALIVNGFRVIRFDNRDVGLSSPANNKVRFDLTRDILKARLGIPIKNNYTLYSMVEDTAALLDALNLKKAHVVGASMGGMIAQIFASLYPHKTASLTSIMSTTNEAGLPLPRFDILLNMAGFGVEKGHQKDVVVRRSLKFWQKITSPHYPTPDVQIAERIVNDFERSYTPAGTLRHTHAILATGGFKHLLHRINCPTQIIHGENDPLVNKKGGIASAKAIRNSKLNLIRGMGHDFPIQLIPKLVELITYNAMKAEQTEPC